MDKPIHLSLGVIWYGESIEIGMESKVGIECNGIINVILTFGMKN